MIGGRRVLVVVPARGGSKGLKNKNIRKVGGVPLVARVGRLVKKLSFVDRAVISTDSPKIASVAVSSGLARPFWRPRPLSGDRIGDAGVLRHALLATERLDKRRYDIVLMLQPTCPLRTPAHVRATVQKLISGRLDSVWTVSPTDLKYHPLKQLSVDAKGRMDYFDKRGRGIIARQQLKPIYHRNGAAYAITRGCLLRQHSIKGRKAGAVIIQEPLISIDIEEDLKKVEALLKRRP